MILLLVIIVALLVAAAADRRIDTHKGSGANRPLRKAAPRRRRAHGHSYGRLAPQQSGTTTAKWWWE